MDFLDALKGPVEALKPGDPFAEGTTLGPLISEKEAQRVGDWISEAVDGGARVVLRANRGAVDVSQHSNYRNFTRCWESSPSILHIWDPGMLL